MGDADLIAALAQVVKQGGGLPVAAGGRVLASLALPFAGLMADQSLGDTQDALRVLGAHARGLGIRVPQPFGALSFLALPVIPRLRLTDRGLVDVTQGRIVSLFAESE